MGLIPNLFVRNNCGKKLLTFSTAFLLLLVTFSMMLIPTVSAASGEISLYAQSSSSALDVLDTFNISVNVSTTNNVNVSWYNVSLLTYNESSLYLANTTANDIYFMNWLENTDQYTINNINGNITNINASNSVNISGNKTAFIVNFTAQSCGMLYINMSNISAMENVTGPFSSISWNNITLEIHPQKPQNFQAQAINSTAVQLNFTYGIGADNVTIKRNTVPNFRIDQGTLVGVVTDNGSFIDTGLNSETTYFYQAWSGNQTEGWYSLQNASDSVITSQEGIFINGTVVNYSDYNEKIVGAEVRLMKMDKDSGDDGGDGNYSEFMNFTDNNGYFELNVSNGSPGQYELVIKKQGFASYMNWNLQLQEDEFKEMDLIPLPMVFASDNQATIKGYIKNESSVALENAEIMLLNMNFNYMIETDGMGDERDKETNTSETGYFEINASFPSNYSIIAFVDGYYAEVNGPFEINSGGDTIWSNITLEPALPDDLDIILEFTDLDDASLTVNRTIRAEAPVLRYALDIIPEIGNSNGVVSSTEVSDYLDFLSSSGPGFMLGDEDEENEEPEEGDEEMGGPEFLSIPLQILLDESKLDSYVAGSHNGTLDNLAGTTAGDNSSIYYNATFNVTLDGKIRNAIEHTFNVTTEHNNTCNLNLTVIFNDFYNITNQIVSTNNSISNTTSNITLIPGENQSSESFAYANFTLELNQSGYSLPIIEVPTWNITDWWQFNKTGGGPLEEKTYTLIGKPLRRWDRMQYYMGNDESRYLCYWLAVSNNSYSNQQYVTINDLQWISMQDDNISLSNDLDFPLYGGKTWNAITWWGESALASVASTNTNKITTNGTYSCVQITYTNQSGLCGEQWYSPTLKFFVNRTQNISGGANITWNLSSFSHGPYIQEVIVGNVTNDTTGLIECLYANLTINITNFYDGPSSYMLDGCLFKENFDGPPEDIMWVSDKSGALRDIIRDTSPISINITYDGGIINASEVDGPYTGQLEMRKDNYEGGDDGYWIDAVDYYSFEANYSHSDFVSPAVTIVNTSSFGNGTQGSYNYLTLNTTLFSSNGGTYRMNAGLEKIINRSGGWQDWRWITGTGTDEFVLSSGSETNISLNFQGQDIYDSGYDGPYHLHLEIEDVNTNTFVYQNDWYVAHEYAYDDFARPCVFFNKTWMGNYTTHDFINESTYLTVNTSITVSDPSGVGDYELCGSVHIGNMSNEEEWGRFIAGTCNDQISLTLGENMIPLNFDLGEVQDRLSQEPGDNHTLKVDFSLSERVGDWIGPEMDYIQYFTKNYSMNDLPDPPISLDAFADSITSPDGNLNISVNINITSDEYANQTYELNGGVHHNHTDDGHWVFITGNWTELSVQSPGTYTVYFEFSGMEISGFGENGPYNIWLGLNKLPEYQMVADDEYNTGSYLYTDFAQPDVQFNDSNTSAEIWGEDYFAVNVSLLVNNPGDYHIGGGIHYIEHMDGWDNWIFLDGFGQEYFISDNTNITVNFSQSLIRSGLPNDYNGPLVVQMGLENASNWQSIDHIEYETDQSYSSSDFSASSVVINSTDVFINDNGDLQLNVTYYATSEQTCNVHGGVNDENWWFITGEWLGDQTLTAGEHNITFNFSGSQIFNSMRDPAKIWFGIEKSSTYQLLANKEISLSGYTYQDFAEASSGVRILRENMDDGTVDYMNSTGTKTYLTVNVSVNVNSGGEGQYWLDGGLDYVHNDNYEWITGVGNEISLYVGNQTIPLNFRASDIQASGKSGTFKAWISIRDMNNNWEDVDNYEYTTSYYSADDAPAPPVSFVEKADESPDIAYINTTGEDYLTVNVTLNVSTGNSGTYDLHGGVNYRTNEGWWQHISGTGDWVQLAEGQNEKTLNFNAGEIKNKLPDGYSDSLSIWIGINDIDDWEEISHTEYISKVLDKTDFPGAKVKLNGNNESIWDENFTVNLTINTSDAFSTGTYEIHGGLNYIETSNGWDEWRYITDFHQDVALSSNSETTYSCNFSAGDVYTALQGKTNKKLTAWIAIENISTWTELTHLEYESANTYSGTDFNPPSIIINCTSDFYNDTSSPQYLQVNLSINNTDDFDGSTTYEINSGIHYVDNSSGWDEWRFITGFYREITPTQNMTIPLNFSGTALYETGETGPFEIWVGISKQGQWDDLAHDEYTTADYSGTTFAVPEIRIIESNITDYVNATGDLTINVTVSESDEGPLGPDSDFVLEGCIHWKYGHQWRWIGWAETFFNSSSGEYNVSLNFDGQELNKAGDDGWSGGKLVAWFAIRNTTTWAELSRVDDYETQNIYAPDDFSDPAILFNLTNDPVENTNGTQGSYDWLNVTVNLTMNTAGTYQMYAGLFDSVNKTILVKTNATINSGDDNVTASFNGTKIYNKGYNGTYEFRAKIVSGETEYDRMKFLLSSYDYTDFLEGTPEAWIEDNFSSYVNATNHDFIVNITINGSVAGNFEIFADLFNSNSSTWITSNSTNITHTFDESANYTLSLRFNGTDIANSNQDGNYSLKYVRLSIDRDQGGNEAWEELDFMKDAFVADYHTHNEFGG